MNYDQISVLVSEENNSIVYMSDPDTYELLYLNRQALQILGNPPQEEWLKKPCYRLLQQKESPCSFCTNHLLTAGEFYCWEHFNKMVGRYFAVKDKLVDLDGKLVRLEIAFDITEKEEAVQQLRRKLEMEQTLVSCIQTLTHITEMRDAISRLLEIVNQYYRAARAYIFELDYDEDIMINTYEWCGPGVEPQIQNLQRLPLGAADRWMAEFREKGEFYITSVGKSVRRDSAEFEILNAQGIESLIAAPLMVGEKIIGFLGVDDPTANMEELTLLRSIAHFVIDDITKRKMTEELRSMSLSDALTGLGNRHRYLLDLKALDGGRLSTLGVVYADINGLKIANDTYGHQYGDSLLRRTAEILAAHFGGDTYRIGGDEFVALCKGVSRESFDRMVQKFREALEGDCDINVSVGVSWSEGKEIDTQRQITHTDDLMYADKQVYYSTRLDGGGKHRYSLTKELLREIGDGRFQVYLQPKMELKSGRLWGAEALVRRMDAAGRILSPVKFIPLYEAEGIIRHVDFFVLTAVCQALRQWDINGYPRLRIAVNLSRFTMMEYDIAGQLAEVCLGQGVDPSRIKIEITESLGNLEADELKCIIRSIRKKGFHIVLDDFGARYSNLALLGNMDFSEVKLDKSLIDQIECNPKQRIIVSHAIQLCRELSLMTSVAEGIETAEQLSLLREMECEIGQGYYFDRPMPVDRFVEKYFEGHAGAVR